MPEEFKIPSPQEITEGLINRPGGSIEGLANISDIIDEGVERGDIRTEISCEETLTEWFVRARSMYVDNNPEPSFRIDVEIGIHLGKCSSPVCRKLDQTYWQVLRPSQAADSSKIAGHLNKLELEIKHL